MSGIRESVGSDVAEVSRDRLGRHRVAGARGRPVLACMTAESVAAETVAAERFVAERFAAGGAAAMTDVRPDHSDAQLFTRAALDYAAHRPGQPLALLQAGCSTADGEPDIGRLRVTGCDITVSLVDDDNRPARAAVKADPGLAASTLGDLRTVPLPPRSFDIVHCALLLDRIEHVELVLDRFISALRPGGLLLLHIRDRDCGVGLLDRVLPQWARRLLWARLAPGRPGPFPAVYEQAASDRGIQAHMQMRGLLISRRETARTRPADPDRLARAVSAACRLICWLTRGRLTDAHDEVFYVIKKPEDPFARVV